MVGALGVGPSAELACSLADIVVTDGHVSTVLAALGQAGPQDAQGLGRKSGILGAWEYSRLRGGP